MRRTWMVTKFSWRTRSGRQKVLGVFALGLLLFGLFVVNQRGPAGWVDVIHKQTRGGGGFNGVPNSQTTATDHEEPEGPPADVSEAENGVKTENHPADLKGLGKEVETERHPVNPQRTDDGDAPSDSYNATSFAFRDIGSLFSDPRYVDPHTPVDQLSIAYSFLVHSKDTILGLIDLLGVIYEPRHVYFIHVDGTIEDKVFETIYDRFKERKNVFWAEERLELSWGNPDIARATVALAMQAVKYNLQRFGVQRFLERGQDGIKPNPWMNMTQTTEHTGNATGEDGLPNHPWKFLINLCGSSFPLHSNTYIEEQLARLPSFSNVVFHSYAQKTCSYDDGSQGSLPEPCNKTPARCLDRECTHMSSTPGQAVLYKGRQWNLLSFYFLWHLYIQDTTGIGTFREWMRFNTRMFASDEILMPSMLMASPFNATGLLGQAPNIYVAPDRLIGTVYMDWGVDRPCRSYRPEHPRGWSPCHLGEKDLGELLEQQDYLFARKFYHDEPIRERLKTSFGEGNLRNEGTKKVPMHE